MREVNVWQELVTQTNLRGSGRDVSLLPTNSNDSLTTARALTYGRLEPRGCPVRLPLRTGALGEFDIEDRGHGIAAVGVAQRSPDSRY